MFAFLRFSIIPLLVLCALRGTLRAEQKPVRFRETFTLNADDAVVRRLEDVQEYVRDKRWEQAAELLLKIPQENGDSLIAVRPGWYVNVTRYCNLLAAALPKEGLEAYRSKIDRRALAWLREGKRLDDERPLRRLLRQAFCSSSGDDALLELGRRAWQRGDVAAARRCWRMLLPAEGGDAESASLRYPDTNFEPAMIRARLLLCDVVSGRLDRAAALLQAFQKKHARAEGRIAGKTGNLAAILAGELKTAQSWPKPKQTAEVSTFAGRPSRDGVAGVPIDIGVRRWRRRLLWRPPDVDGKTGAGNRKGFYPACHPVVWNDKVFLADAASVYGYNLTDGSAAFGVNLADDERSPEQGARLYSIAANGTLPRPDERLSGIAHFTLTVHDGRLYARLGSPVTGRLKSETKAVRSSLVCLDLARAEGKLVWKIDSQTIGIGWEFEGAPLVRDGRLYVAFRRRLGETQIHVACFDAESAKLQWTTRVGTAVAVGEDEKNHVGGLLLTLAGDRLFLSTDLGAIASLDARDGGVEWAVTYETLPAERRNELDDPRKRGLTPCLFHEGTLYAAPADACGSVMALDAETGELHWKRPLRGGVRHLLGVVREGRLRKQAGTDDRRLIVAGDRLWGLDPADGSVRWTVGFENPAGFGFGRGTIAGDRVYWPLRKEVVVVDAFTGTLRGRVALYQMQRGYGGNLLIAGKRLIVAEPRRLVVYGTQPGRLRGK